MTDAVPQRESLRIGALVARACFLACSWCWGIGMYLPVFLTRDFGWPGWVVFIVPNTIGAAAVGMLFLRGGSSRATESSHPAAFRWFSIITILFHAYFLALMLGVVASDFGQDPELGSVGALLMVALTIPFAALGRRGWHIGSIFCFVASCACVVGMLLTSPPGALSLPAASGAFPLADLAATSPVIVMGFLLCPVLDLTFHRTRREEPGRTGTTAFILGLGVLFPALMIFTLLYSGGIAKGVTSLYMYGHMLGQAGFTIAAHLRELFARGFFIACDEAEWRDPDRRATRRARDAGAILIVLFAVLVVGMLVWGQPDLHPGYTARRLVYDLFMSFYGLVFPAYVWIVMIPRRSSAGRPRHAAWAVATLLAAPFFWFGAIQQQHLWLPIGVAIPLLTPWVLGLRGSRKTLPTGVGAP